MRLLIALAYACLLLLAFVGGVLLGIAREHDKRISTLEQGEGISVHWVRRPLRTRAKEWVRGQWARVREWFAKRWR